MIPKLLKRLANAALVSKPPKRRSRLTIMSPLQDLVTAKVKDRRRLLREKARLEGLPSPQNESQNQANSNLGSTADTQTLNPIESLDAPSQLEMMNYIRKNKKKIPDIGITTLINKFVQRRIMIAAYSGFLSSRFPKINNFFRLRKQRRSPAEQFELRRPPSSTRDLSTFPVLYDSTFPAVDDSQVQYYSRGSELWTRALQDIGNAKHHVWMCSYIFLDDSIGDRVIASLTAASKRGVHCLIILDHLGSNPAILNRMGGFVAAGGTLLRYNQLSIGSLFKSHDYIETLHRFGTYRNHRKLMIIDGIGYCGGMNVGGEYSEPSFGGNFRFRDSHTRISGHGAQQLAEAFVDTAAYFDPPRWQRLFRGTANTPLLSEMLKIRLVDFEFKPDGISSVQVLLSDPRKRKTEIYDCVLKAINCATKTLHITTPYFMPPRHIKNALIAASQRGVDVRILTAGKCDIPFVSTAAAHVFPDLIANNITVKLYMKRELHAKLMVVDSASGVVGSFNLDRLSSIFNLECNYVCIDDQFSNLLLEQFTRDEMEGTMVDTEMMERRQWYEKIWSAIVYRVMSILFYPFYRKAAKSASTPPSQKPSSASSNPTTKNTTTSSSSEHIGKQK